MLPVLLLDLHCRDLEPVSCGFFLVFIPDLVKVVNAHENNLVLHLALIFTVFRSIKRRDFFLFIRQAFLASLARGVGIADTRDLPLVCSQLLFYCLDGVRFHALVSWFIRFLLVSIVVVIGLSLDSCLVVAAVRQFVLNMSGFHLCTLIRK